MAKQVVIQFHNRQIKFSALPSLKELFTKVGIAKFSDKLAELSLYLYILVAPIAIVLFPAQSAAALSLFYLVAGLIFVSLALKFALIDREFLVEVPWLVNVILFAVVNMTLLLAADKRAILVGNDNIFESGLTYVSIVLVFYYLSLKSKTLKLADRLIDLIVISFVLVAIFSLFDHIILANLALFTLATLVPIGIYRLAAAKPSVLSIVAIIAGLIYVIRYIQTVNNFLVLTVAGLFTAIFSIYWVYKQRSEIAKTVKIALQHPTAALVLELRPLLILAYALVLIALGVVSISAAGNGMAAKEVTTIVEAYRSSFLALGAGQLTVLLGNVASSDAAVMPLFANLIRSGLVILLTHVAIMIVGLVKAYRDGKSTLALGMIMLTLSAFIFPIPAAIYIFYWVILSMLLIDESAEN
jgi:hypothetical protein